MVARQPFLVALDSFVVNRRFSARSSFSLPSSSSYLQLPTPLLSPPTCSTHSPSSWRPLSSLASSPGPPRLRSLTPPLLLSPDERSRRPRPGGATTSSLFVAQLLLLVQVIHTFRLTSSRDIQHRDTDFNNASVSLVLLSMRGRPGGLHSAVAPGRALVAGSLLKRQADRGAPFFFPSSPSTQRLPSSLAPKT